MTLNIRALTAHTTRLPISLVGACLIFVTMADASAETRYVSDDLGITLRTGQSTQHQILRMVTSGTPLEVLETNEESGYTRVRTPQGVEGWVVSRFLMDHPGAQQQLANATKKIARLEENNKNLRTQLNDTSGDKNSLTKEKNQLTTENEKLQMELNHIRKTAASALAIESENKKLSNERVRLETELQAVQQENVSLKDRRDREWFVRGAAVVIIGILIGLILPKIRFRSRSRWNSL
jgi:SH3 domain protein